MNSYSALVALGPTDDPVPTEDLLRGLSHWSAAVTDSPDGSREVLVSGDYISAPEAARLLTGVVLDVARVPESALLEVRVVPDAHHDRLEA